MAEETINIETGEILVSPIRRSESIAKLIDALAKASLEFGEVAKETENPFYKSTYADLATLIKATRPALGKHGLVLSQFPMVSLSRARAGVTSLLSHASGEWLEAELTLPVTKQDAQGVGSAITYSRRYAYQSILNIAGEEDDDGQAAVGKTKKAVLDKIAEAESAFDQRTEGEQTLAIFQMKGVEDMCKIHGRTEDQLNAYIKAKFGVARIEKVRKVDFETLKAWIVGKEPLQDTLQTQQEALQLQPEGKVESKPSQKDWARLYGSLEKKGISREEMKSYYTKKFRVTSGTQLTHEQFAQVEKEVSTWQAASVTSESE